MFKILNVPPLYKTTFVGAYDAIAAAKTYLKMLRRSQIQILDPYNYKITIEYNED